MADNITNYNPDADAIAAEFKEYAYSVSHDLSAPVRAMVEFSKLLTGEHGQALSDEGKEYLAVIIENGQKMQAMMEGLLRYSRLNTTAKPYISADATGLIDVLVRAMEPQLSAVNAVVEYANLPTVMADREQLMQVFRILIENAVIFQAKGNAPHITILAENKPGHWQFTVKDNGIGIAPQYHQKIFKLFQRLNADTEYPGVGIGLTLAQKIVERHGGKIWCESASGAGSQFHFTLPK